jgi:hypothetical protein
MDVSGPTAITPITEPVPWGPPGWRTSAALLTDAALARELRMPLDPARTAPPVLPPALAPVVVTAVASIIDLAPAVAIAAASAEAAEVVSPLRMEVPAVPVAVLASSAPVLSASAAATPNRLTTGVPRPRSTTPAARPQQAVLPVDLDAIGVD